MKCTILLGTLKTSGLSNTATLCEFVATRMAKAGIECETIKLVDHYIPPGTYSDMGNGDEWPGILDRVLASDMLLLATPIWWSNPSSLLQRVIERFDELHDYVMEGKPSGLEGKTGGIVITGDSDGAQHIIGNLCNFFNGVGLLIPPYATLSVMWDRQAKGADPDKAELMKKYEKDYTKTADRMIQQLLAYAGAAPNAK
ncbi:MAG TPA: NAD(P)H-dependent oxidoreductase [Gemmatimonadaceae bacterium]